LQGNTMIAGMTVPHKTALGEAKKKHGWEGEQADTLHDRVCSRGFISREGGGPNEAIDGVGILRDIQTVCSLLI
jgi:hypothetical protein